MFDIGFWELAVIGVVALLVVGPERMPALIKTTGQWVGHVQRLARDMRREIEREAQTDEFKALNREFLEEDQRLKASTRPGNPSPQPLPEPETDTTDEQDTAATEKTA